MTDELISKTDVVKIVKSVLSPASSLTNVARARRQMLDQIYELESKPEPHWIPFKHRKPTEEEGTAFDYIMDCKCPEDGQNILVSINIQGHEPVQYDTFYGGGGEECCLESGYELVEEATAWMPLPEPYKEVTE